MTNCTERYFWLVQILKKQNLQKKRKTKKTKNSKQLLFLAWQAVVWWSLRLTQTACCSQTQCCTGGANCREECWNVTPAALSLSFFFFLNVGVESHGSPMKATAGGKKNQVTDLFCTLQNYNLSRETPSVVSLARKPAISFTRRWKKTFMIEISSVIPWSPGNEKYVLLW